MTVLVDLNDTGLGGSTSRFMDKTFKQLFYLNKLEIRK